MTLRWGTIFFNLIIKANKMHYFSSLPHKVEK